MASFESGGQDPILGNHHGGGQGTLTWQEAMGPTQYDGTMPAETLLDIGRGWLGIGVVTAAAFIPFGLSRVEAGAVGAWPFRLLLIPGVVLLWPLVLWRWAQIERARRPVLHRPPLLAQHRLSVALSLTIPLIVALGLAVRQVGPFEREAVQIEAPSEAGR